MFFTSQSKLSTFSRSIDQFSMPFEFNVENNHKKKSTEVGGLLTIIVYSLSLSYLIYLLNLYFGHGIDPNISVTTLTSTNDDYYGFEEDTFAFGFFTQEENNQKKSIIELEKETGKKYLIFQASYNYFDDNNVYQSQLISLKNCNYPNNLKGYFCIDYTQHENKKLNIKFNYLSTNFMFEGIQVFILKCENQPNCAQDDEIKQKIHKLNNMINVAIKISRYNTYNEKQESFYITDEYGLDPFIGESRKYQLIQSKTTLINGILLQNKSFNSSIETIQKQSDIHSIDSIKTQKGSQIQGLISFRLSSELKYIIINYAQITQILAQSMSIYGFLLIIGQLGYKISEIKLYQGMSNIIIQEYYKKTAIQLINYFTDKKIQQENKKHIKDQNKKSKQINLKEQFSSDQQLKQESNQQKESSAILETYQNVNKTYFPLLIDQNIKFTLLQKLSILIKKVIPKRIIKKNSNTPLKDINHVINNTKRLLNIYDFIQDFVKLKMMVGLLFTKEQYAATKYCGVDASNIEKLLQATDKKILTSNTQNNPLNTPPLLTINKLMNYDPDENIQNVKQVQHEEHTALHAKSNKQQVQLSLDDNSQLNKNEISSQQQEKNKQEKEQNTLSNNKLTLDSQNQQSPGIKLVLQDDIKIQMQQDNQSKYIQNNNNNINHLEILDSIDKDETYQKLYLEQFLNKLSSNLNGVSELDLRIYQCIVQNNVNNNKQ